jgi:Tfp pilus assembly protein PilV
MRTVHSPSFVRGIGRARATATPITASPKSMRSGARAFTLLEVMIALAIFFMAIFVILESTSRSLGAARSLQITEPSPAILIADLALTNRIEEGVLEGQFDDPYPGVTWTREIVQVRTNGLFQVDFTLRWHRGRRAVESKSSILLWRPESQVSTLGGLRR